MPFYNYIIVFFFNVYVLFHCCLIKISFMFQGMLFIGDDDSNVVLALFTNMILVFS